jgi:hypothetical protein
VLNFDSGCYQTLGPNERVIVDEAVCAAGGGSTSGIQQSIVAEPGFVFGGMAAIGLTGGLILSNCNRDTPGSP